MCVCCMVCKVCVCVIPSLCMKGACMVCVCVKINKTSKKLHLPHMQSPAGSNHGNTITVTDGDCSLYSTEHQ